MREVSSLQSLSGGKSVHCSLCREGGKSTVHCRVSVVREVSSLQSLCREGGKSVHCRVCRVGSQFTAVSVGREGSQFTAESLS